MNLFLKQLHTNAVLSKCSYLIRISSYHSFKPLVTTKSLKTTYRQLPKSISVKSSDHPSFHKISLENEEIKRTTFADVEPIEIDSSFVQLLKSQFYPDQTSIRTSSGFAHRASDDFLLAHGLCLLKEQKRCSSQESNPYHPFHGALGKRWNATEKTRSKEQDTNTDFTPREDDEVPKSKTAQLKKLFAVYGSFAVGFHIAISLVSLGICYLLVSSGIDMIGILAKMGIETSAIAGGASTMVVAYAIHKLIVPLRASITIISVPILIRYLRRLGYFKK